MKVFDKRTNEEVTFSKVNNGYMIITLAGLTKNISQATLVRWYKATDDEGNVISFPAAVRNEVNVKINNKKEIDKIAKEKVKLEKLGTKKLLDDIKKAERAKEKPTNKPTVNDLDLSITREYKLTFNSCPALKSRGDKSLNYHLVFDLTTKDLTELTIVIHDASWIAIDINSRTIQEIVVKLGDKIIAKGYGMVSINKQLIELNHITEEQSSLLKHDVLTMRKEYLATIPIIENTNNSPVQEITKEPDLVTV